MKKYGFVSKYVLRRKKRKNVANNDNIPNIVNRLFNERKKYEVFVSDLTYIKNRWKMALSLRFA